MTIYDLFKQSRHPLEVNDYFHTYNLSNILNVVYWDKFFQKI